MIRPRATRKVRSTQRERRNPRGTGVTRERVATLQHQCAQENLDNGLEPDAAWKLSGIETAKHGRAANDIMFAISIPLNRSLVV